MHIRVPSRKRNSLQLVNRLYMLVEFFERFQLCFIQRKPAKFCIKLRREGGVFLARFEGERRRIKSAPLSYLCCKDSAQILPLPWILLR